MTKTIYEASYKEASILPEIYGNLLVTEKGGDGSGNFDHTGRPGQVGGSAPKGSPEQAKPAGKFDNMTDSDLAYRIRDNRSIARSVHGKVNRGKLPVDHRDRAERLDNEANEMEAELKRRRQAKSEAAALPSGEKKITPRELEENVIGADGIKSGVPGWFKTGPGAEYHRAFERSSEPNVFTFARGYFYRPSGDVGGFRDRVIKSLNDNGYDVEEIASGDNWAPFKGGAKTFATNSSFFWVTLKLKRRAQKEISEKGGDGSGNFGHAGRPGEIGGSAPNKAGGKTRERKFTEHTSAHLGALIYDGRNKISELADKYGDRPQSGGYLKMRALENEVRKMEEELRARELEESDAKLRSDVADLPAGWEGSGSGIVYSKRTEITSEYGGKEKRSTDVTMDTRTKKWMVGLTSVWNSDFQKQERITYGGFPDRKSAIEYAESFHDSKKNPFARSFMRDSAPDKAEWVQFPGQRETQPILRKRS